MTTQPIPLPAAFQDRMRSLLGAEAPAFLASLQDAPRQGLRVHTAKAPPDELRRRLPFALAPLPWCPEGFLVVAGQDTAPGAHPYHAAGCYYLQDPSAMVAAVLLDPQPGQVVLDLCAAPGGKATHIAARLRNQGLLVANESVRPRAAALVENLERFGVTNALVTSETPETLARQWPGLFDAVLVDAPCSGEGMFRKTPAARRQWRPAAVAGCALRQANILESAARLLRPGGRLVYATCTFAPEENEAAVAAFLHQRPEFALVQPPQLPGFDPGRPDWIAPRLARGLPLERCVRIWPHRAPGEGHFFAILEHGGESGPASIEHTPHLATADALRPLRAFWAATLPGRPPPAAAVARFGDWLHLLPLAPERWQPLRPLRAGLRLGRLQGDRFEPHHALALTLAAGDVREALDLPAAAAETAAYLRGETLTHAGSDGWLLVTVDGFALGWGRRSQGTIKNYYPRGWRRQ